VLAQVVACAGYYGVSPRIEIEEKMNEVVNTSKTNTIVNRIQKIYCLLTIISAIAVIYKISEGSGDVAAEAALAFFVYFTIYIGLRQRKTWLIAIILIFSAFALLISFLASFEPAKDVASLLGKIGDIIIVIFSAYQIHFFSKKEVKPLFNAKGTIIY